MLSSQALASLIQISAFAISHFGQQKKPNISRCFGIGGVERPSCLIQAEQHHIYYRLGAAHIEIIDVLHQSMEPNLYL